MFNQYVTPSKLGIMSASVGRMEACSFMSQAVLFINFPMGILLGKGYARYGSQYHRIW